MAHLLVDGHVGVDLPTGGDPLVMEVFGEAQQDAHAQLIVQEAALDVPLLGDAGPGVEADDVAGVDAQLLRIVGSLHILVQDHLHTGELADGVAVVPVHVDGRVIELQRALVDAVELGDDATVLRLGVVGIQTPQGRYAQPPVALDLTDHAAQGIEMRFQPQPVVLVRAAQVRHHAALAGPPDLAAQGLEFLQTGLRRRIRVPRGAVDTEQLHGLLHRKLHILLIDHVRFLSIVFSIWFCMSISIYRVIGYDV